MYYYLRLDGDAKCIERTNYVNNCNNAMYWKICINIKYFFLWMCVQNTSAWTYSQQLFFFMIQWAQLSIDTLLARNYSMTTSMQKIRTAEKFACLTHILVTKVASFTFNVTPRACCIVVQQWEHSEEYQLCMWWLTEHACWTGMQYDPDWSHRPTVSVPCFMHSTQV